MKTVILAAGFGSRLWPVSTSEKPKQFQPLLHGTSLLRYTYDQLAEITSIEDIFILILEGMQPLVLAELPDLASSQLIVVPERRNTLPHTLWALLKITENNFEPVLFKSVDHYILNPFEYRRSMKHCIDHYDRSLQVITMLCTPFDVYNSNDGYAISDGSGTVLEFLEKPTEPLLQQRAEGRAVYRSPMIYIATKQAFMSILDSFDEAWSTTAQRLLAAPLTDEQQELFLSMPFLDISSYIFERSQQLRIAEITYEYIDVGRFEEIYTLNDKDIDGNVVIGAVIMGSPCHNCLIINETAQPFVALSMNDVIMVHTEAGSLMTSFADASKIGEIYKSRIQKPQPSSESH